MQELEQKVVIPSSTLTLNKPATKLVFWMLNFYHHVQFLITMWANYNFFMPSFIVNYVWVGRLAILFGQKRIEQYLCSVLKIFLLFLFLFLRDLQLRSCQNLNISFSTCVFSSFVIKSDQKGKHYSILAFMKKLSQYTRSGWLKSHYLL